MKKSLIVLLLCLISMSGWSADHYVRDGADGVWDRGAYEYGVVEKAGAQYKRTLGDAILTFGLFLSFCLNLIGSMIIYKMYKRVRLLHTDLKAMEDPFYIEALYELNKYLGGT